MANINPTPLPTTFPITFRIVHDFMEGYGKVPETFHNRFGKLVGPYGTIIASNGRRFLVSYVNGGAKGGFISGWNIFMRNCVEERNVWVILKYHGGSLFSFTEEEQGERIYMGYPYPPVNPNGRCYKHPIDTDTMMTHITLTDYSVSNNHQNLPTAFVISCLNVAYKHALIEVKQGRVWVCRVYSNPNKPTQARISSGWKDFCREHNLRAGDRIRSEVRDWTKNRWVTVIERSQAS